MRPVAWACVLIIGSSVVARVQMPTPWFTDVTDATGLTNVIGRNISVADVNGDGYPDLLLHLPLNEATGDVLNKQFLYLNQPDRASGGRRFLDFTAESGIRGNRRGTSEGRQSSFAIFADVNNDGNLDMFSGVYGHRLENYTDRGDRNDLYLGDGHGHFTLAPTSTFHTEPLYNTAGAVFFDYDRDGKIDLFIGNWYGANSTLSESILYEGGGDGSFENVNVKAGLAGNLGAVYAVTAMDYNNDGYPDLMVPSYGHTQPGEQSVLWKNDRNGTFSFAQDTARYGTFEGYGAPVAGFGSMPRDFNNDGWPDVLELLVHGDASGGMIKTTVLVNYGGVFSWNFDALPRVGGNATYDLLDHYGSWFNFNNDGLPDLVITRCCNGGNNGNWISLFQQMPDHTFVDVTQLSGLGVINADPSLRPHNVTSLDYDHDGAEDLIIGFADARQGVRLWHNNIGKLNNSISIRLRGSGRPGGSNTNAIGAKVEVTANGITQVQTIDAGNGQFGPQRPFDLTFGISKATVINHLKITWPNSSGTVSDYYNLKPNQVMVISESMDFNGDGCTDRGDMNMLLAEVRKPSPSLLFDLNGDGKVDISDARRLVTSFSRPNGAPCQ